jgi:carbonic anhydrase
MLVETTLGPHAVLAALKEVECSFGRVRGASNSPRTLDLDLIAHGRVRLSEPDLEIPHPRASERLFVMGPLAEIAPDWTHPVTGQTAELLAARACVGLDAKPVSLGVAERRGSFYGFSMLDHLKTNNRAWAAAKVAADEGFFKRLEGQQAPEYLWIGCSDSRVPANEIVGLDPGELFVHRNVANLAPPQDANYLSVLQFAVDVLKVKHILVVGHYGCGGVKAAISGQRLGLVDHWLHPIRETCHDHRHELNSISDETVKLDRLCELNVVRQVRNVASDVFVQDAWARGQSISVHGWVYSLGNGLVTDLGVTMASPEDIDRLS